MPGCRARSVHLSEHGRTEALIKEGLSRYICTYRWSESISRHLLNSLMTFLLLSVFTSVSNVLPDDFMGVKVESWTPNQR